MDTTHLSPVDKPHTADTNVVCLTNAQVVLPDRVMTGSVVVEGETIVEVSPHSALRPGAIDCEGAYVMPGLIELHTDNLERHIEPRNGVDWPHLPAILAHDGELASTGITTVFDAMRVGSIHSGKKGDYKRYARGLASEIIAARDAGVLRISHFLHLRAETCSETLLEELDEFTEHDRIGIVSLMDHTPGQRQFGDLSKLKQYIAKKRGMSDEDFVAHVANLRRLRDLHGEAHEQGTVAAARRLGAALASHDDTTTAHVTTSKRNGVRFAEFPTSVEAAEACRASAIDIMMGAPNIIRGGSHSGNVSALELAERGLLDIVSSDYVPGALLLSAFRLAELWQDIPRAIATVTAAPARVTGLTDRGAVQEGLRGDLLMVSNMAGTPIVRGVWSRGQRVG